MTWIDRLEQKFGFIAIPHLIPTLIVGQAMATLLGLQQPAIVRMMVLDPAMVMQGEWWRLLTFVFTPSLNPLSIILAVFWFMFLWTMGKALETEWGDFKTSLYLMIGVVAEAGVCMAAYKFFGIRTIGSGFYFFASIQLAFTFYFPEYVIYLYFILPVKMRWLAWFMAANFAWQIFRGGAPEFFLICGALANYLLYIGPQYLESVRLRRGSYRPRKDLRASIRVIEGGKMAKVCCTCGRTAEEADIRLCSCMRCGDDGKFWCTEDLHEHVKKH